MFWRMPPSFEAFCLNQLNGVSKAQRPARGHVVIGLLGAPHVVPLHLHLDWHLVYAVEERDFIGRSERTALGAGAVVAIDIDDQRVVELAHLFDGVDHTADLVVAVRGIGSKDFRLLDKQFLRLRSQVIPVLEQIARPGFQLGVLRDHAEFLLVGENLLAQFVVALVKQVHSS